MSMAANFFDERKYPHLADLLRCQAKVVIGENPHMDGCAHIDIDEGEIIEVSRKTYESLDELLKELDTLAKKHAAENW